MERCVAFWATSWLPHVTEPAPRARPPAPQGLLRPCCRPSAVWVGRRFTRCRFSSHPQLMMCL